MAAGGVVNVAPPERVGDDGGLVQVDIHEIVHKSAVLQVQQDGSVLSDGDALWSETRGNLCSIECQSEEVV